MKLTFTLPAFGTPLLCALALALAACKDAPSKPKQAQTVKLLPDAPPPPPPKPEEKRPEPKREEKPQQQAPQPKPQETPQQQALKTDEAPGQGPGSGLTSGAVTQDYSGGATSGTGGGAQVGSAEVGVNRMAANAYANAATRAINDYLNRDKELKQADYRLQVHVWLQADGRLERAELVGSTGNADTDAALRRALERFPGTRSPLPDKLPQPLRLQVSNRMMG